MRLVTINIRGVRDKDAYIRSLARKHRADFVLLQETYIDTEPKFKDLLEKIRNIRGTPITRNIKEQRSVYPQILR